MNVEYKVAATRIILLRRTRNTCPLSDVSAFQPIVVHMDFYSML